MVVTAKKERQASFLFSLVVVAMSSVVWFSSSLVDISMLVFLGVLSFYLSLGGVRLFDCAVAASVDEDPGPE